MTIRGKTKNQRKLKACVQVQIKRKDWHLSFPSPKLSYVRPLFRHIALIFHYIQPSRNKCNPFTPALYYAACPKVTPIRVAVKRADKVGKVSIDKLRPITTYEKQCFSRGSQFRPINSQNLLSEPGRLFVRRCCDCTLNLGIFRPSLNFGKVTTLN